MTHNLYPPKARSYRHGGTTHDPEPRAKGQCLLLEIPYSAGFRRPRTNSKRSSGLAYRLIELFGTIRKLSFEKACPGRQVFERALIPEPSIEMITQTVAQEQAACRQVHFENALLADMENTELPTRWSTVSAPFNRQSDRYRREGIDLSVSALADQMGACTTVLQPLHALIEAHVLAAERLHADNATVPILAKGKTVTGHCATTGR